MSTYYIDQLASYNDNYDDAIKKIDGISNKMNNLYNSFAGATGADVESIRSDLTSINNELSNIKKEILAAKTSSNTHATNSDNVYDKAMVEHNLQTPSFGSADYTYESTGYRKIYIEEGIIYEEETFEKKEKNPGFDLLETIGLKEKQKTYVKSTVYAGVEEMIQGELKLYPALKKSEEYTSGSGGGASHGW